MNTQAALNPTVIARPISETAQTVVSDASQQAAIDSDDAECLAVLSAVAFLVGDEDGIGDY